MLRHFYLGSWAQEWGPVGIGPRALAGVVQGGPRLGLGWGQGGPVGGLVALGAVQGSPRAQKQGGLARWQEVPKGPENPQTGFSGQYQDDFHFSFLP